MSLIYITGPSGSGKSTVRNELVRRGYEAHDTDEDGFCAWYNVETGQQVERPTEVGRAPGWYKEHEFRISPERVKVLAEQAKTKLIFLCGMPANDLSLSEYYDTIICLVIDTATMQRRVAARETNTFGKSEDELKLMLYWHDKILERRKNLGATMIDATQPIQKVIEQVLAISMMKPTE